MYKYTKGSKWVATESSQCGWYVKGDVVTCIEDSDYCLVIKVGITTQSVDSLNFILSSKDKVADAKYALEVAEANYEKALKEHEDSCKFTEEDIKNLMVVKFETLGGSLRLVTMDSDRYMMVDTQGSNCMRGIRKSLLETLNSSYSKTNLTIKDFANAVK